MTSLRPWVRVLVPVVALVVAVAGLAAFFTGPSTRTVSAEFTRTVGLFEGSDVRVMGLKVGEVTRIVPSGTSVRVDMTYDAAYRLPADAQAVIVAPSVIADRFVQITPGYVDGPVLASGAVIGMDRTHVPVELDRSLQVTNDLMAALGPHGANRHGALSAALHTLASVMQGTGADARRTLHDAADLSDVLASGAQDTAGTVRHLSRVTGTLAAYDHDVRSFNRHLASVSHVLAGDSGQLSAMLASLARSLVTVEAFVRDNRRALVGDLGHVSAVASALVAERQSLDELLGIVPLAFTNLVETYDPQAQAVRTRANFTEILRAVDKVVCQEATKAQGHPLAGVCRSLTHVVSQLPALPHLPGVPPVGRRSAR
ncbi:MAG: MCE family protein [Oryzihumus sp.]